MALQREVIEADEKLARLYRLVEDGLTDLDPVLRDRLASLKATRDQAQAALDRAKESSAETIQVDPAVLERFGRTMQEHFTSGSVPFRKSYLQAIVECIEVGDHQIRIKGSKEVLEQAVMASRAATGSGSQMSTKWRARKDSNLRPQLRSLERVQRA